MSAPSDEERRNGPRSQDLGPFVVYGPLIYGVLAAVVGALLIRNIAWTLRFEDAYIVLRYARNLLDGSGFVFNPGERVLGVTTPLQTLISTLYVGFGGEQAPAWQNIAGVFALIAEGALVLTIGRRLGHPVAGLFAAVATLMNLHLSYLYLGMEVHLFVVLVLLAFLLLIDDAPQGRLGFVLGLAFLTRYDAALLAGLIGAALWIRDRRYPWRLLAGFCVPVLPWVVFSLAYFHTLVPNTLSAKEGYRAIGDYLVRVFFEQKADVKQLVGMIVPVEVLKAGLSYLWPLPVIGASFVLTRRDRKLILLGLYPALHVLVYAMIGSDPGFTWHYYLLHPIFTLLTMIGLAATTRSTPAKLSRFAAPICALLLLVLVGRLILGVSTPHRMDPHTRQLHEMGAWLDERFSAPASLLQPSIGVLGWTSGLPMIDHAGLVTPGFYYFDDEDCTPLDEILDARAPDLALLTRSTLDARPDFQEALTVRGYEVIHVFDEPILYELWSKL